MHTSSGANCVFVSVRNSTILHNSEHRYFFVDQAEKWSLVSVKIAIATAIWYNRLIQKLSVRSFIMNNNRRITNAVFDEFARIPEYKVCAVKLEKMAGNK